VSVFGGDENKILAPAIGKKAPLAFLSILAEDANVTGRTGCFAKKGLSITSCHSPIYLFPLRKNYRSNPKSVSN